MILCSIALIAMPTSGPMEWKSLAAIIDAGYQHATEVLDNWSGFDP